MSPLSFLSYLSLTSLSDFFLFLKVTSLDLSCGIHLFCNGHPLMSLLNFLFLFLFISPASQGDPCVYITEWSMIWVQIVLKHPETQAPSIC